MRLSRIMFKETLYRCWTLNNGFTTVLNHTGGGNVFVDGINNATDTHLMVNHKNHGMYLVDNRVTISELTSPLDTLQQQPFL